MNRQETEDEFFARCDKAREELGKPRQGWTQEVDSTGDPILTFDNDVLDFHVTVRYSDLESGYVGYLEDLKEGNLNGVGVFSWYVEKGDETNEGSAPTLNEACGQALAAAREWGAKLVVASQEMVTALAELK